jgi:hypothetical protein
MSETEDPWAKARESQREDVAAVFAPRERRCPSCGSVETGAGRVCSNCGADLTARAPRRIPWRALLIAGAAVLVVAAVAIPVTASLRGDAADERAAAERRQARLVEAERLRQIRDSKPVRAAGPALAEGGDPIAHREQLVTDAESKITSDARARVAAGTLDGDIKGTDCDVFPLTDERRAAEADPDTPAGRYDCTAYTSKLEGNQGRTAIFGHPFWLVIDYRKSRYVWCKLTPRAGEGGSVLISVPVPVPCRDPEGPG